MYGVVSHDFAKTLLVFCYYNSQFLKAISACELEFLLESGGRYDQS